MIAIVIIVDATLTYNTVCFINIPNRVFANNTEIILFLFSRDGFKFKAIGYTVLCNIIMIK